MFDVEMLKKLKRFYRTMVENMEKEGCTDAAADYTVVAEILDIAIKRPDALYTLLDTGIYNEAIIGYATEAARWADMSEDDVESIRYQMGEVFDFVGAKQAEAKARRYSHEQTPVE